MPDAYDRQLAAFMNLPDVVKTKAATIRTAPPLGIGGTRLFIVQTIRQRDRGDLIFLEISDATGATRLVLPMEVTALIARQSATLTGKARSKAAKQSAADRAARGIQPGFLREAK